MAGGITLDCEKTTGELEILGIDEAGRGPLAGSVYAAAVHVPLELAEELLHGAWSAINDSKKLTPRRREALAETIKNTLGCKWAIASASPKEIDEFNILRATHLAMRRAALEAATAAGLSKPFILVDGLAVPSLPFPSKAIVKGDSKSLLIAAASILAKTARDADCLRMEKEYPGYGFAKHKGYPTKAHVEALQHLGPCPEHRRSFSPVSDFNSSLLTPHSYCFPKDWA